MILAQLKGPLRNMLYVPSSKLHSQTCDALHDFVLYLALCVPASILIEICLHCLKPPLKLTVLFDQLNHITARWMDCVKSLIVDAVDMYFGCQNEDDCCPLKKLWILLCLRSFLLTVSFEFALYKAFVPLSADLWERVDFTLAYTARGFLRKKHVGSCISECVASLFRRRSFYLWF